MNLKTFVVGQSILLGLIALSHRAGAQAAAWTPGSRVHVGAGFTVCARVDTLGSGTGTCGTGGVLRVAGDKGTIVRGPAGSTTKWGTSWFVDYDTGQDGWSSQLYLVLDTLAAPGGVAKVTVSLAQVTLFQGQTVQLAATLTNSLGAVLVGPVTWSASGAVGVDNTGKVMAVSVGTGTVTATAANGVTGSCVVTVVVVPVKLLTITPAVDTLTVGQSVQLTASTFDSAGHLLTGRPITWGNVTPTVISVSPSGLVGALAPGFGQPLATSGTITSTAAVVVVGPSSIVVLRLDGFSQGSMTLLLGQSHQFQAVATDINNLVIPTSLSWRATAPAVATVDGNGLVHAVGAGLGQDTIIATTPNGVRATFLVNVPFNLPLNCGVAVPPPVGCGLRSGTWSLMGVDTANGTYGPWFRLDSLGRPYKAIRVVQKDTTF